MAQGAPELPAAPRPDLKVLKSDPSVAPPPDAPAHGEGHGAHDAHKPKDTPDTATPPKPEPIRERADAVADTLSIKKQETEVQPETVKELTNFLDGYTRRILALRQDEEVWNSNFATNDRQLLSLIGIPEDFDPSKDSPALTENINKFLSSPENKKLATEMLIDNAVQTYRVQGYRLEAQRGVFQGAIEKAAGEIDEIKLKGKQPNRRVERLKTLSRLISKDPTLKPKFDIHLLADVKGLSDIEKRYLKGITTIDTDLLQVNAQKTGLVPTPEARTAAGKAEEAGKNLRAAADFYKAKGFPIENFGLFDKNMYKENRIETRTAEEFDRKVADNLESRLTELTMTDRWGQDASNVCFLRGDCSGLTIKKDTLGIETAEAYREYAIKNNLPPIPGTFTTFIFNGVTYDARDINHPDLYAVQMKHARQKGTPPPRVPDSVRMSTGNQLVAFENLLEAELVNDHLKRGVPPPSGPEIAAARARAVKEYGSIFLGPRDTRNYIDEVPETRVVRRSGVLGRLGANEIVVNTAVRERNAQRAVQLRELERRARNAVRIEMGVTQIGFLETHPDTEITEEVKILRARAEQLGSDSGKDVEELQDQVAKLTAAETAAQQKVTDELGGYKEAKDQLDGVIQHGVDEFRLSRTGDFGANIDRALSEVKTQLQEAGAGERFDQAQQKEQTYQTKAREEEQARKSLARRLGDLSLSGDTLSTQATDKTKEIRREIGDASSPTTLRGKIAEAESPTNRTRLRGMYYTNHEREFLNNGGTLDATERARLTAQANNDADREIRDIVRGLNETISQRERDLDALYTQIETYDKARGETSQAEEVIVRPAANEYDLRSAQENHDIFARGAGTPLRGADLREARDIDDLVNRVIAARDAGTFIDPRVARLTPEQLKEMLIQARTEQKVIDRGVDNDATPAFTTLDKIALHPPTTVTTPITTEELVTMSVDDLSRRITKDYGITFSDDQITAAKAEAAKRLRNRYITFLEEQKTAQAGQDTEALTKKKEGLEKLKTDFDAAKKKLAEEESTLYEKSNTITISELKSAYDWFVRPGRKNSLDFTDVGRLDVDDLVKEAHKKGYGLAGVPGATDDEKNAWIRKQAVLAKAHQRAFLRRQTTDKSPTEVQYSRTVDVAGATIKPEDLLSGQPSDIITRLQNPPYTIGLPPRALNADEAEAEFRAAQAEAKRVRRIEYEELLKVQSEDATKQKEAKQEELKLHLEARRKSLPELEGVVAIMDNFESLPNAALNLKTNASKYTDNEELTPAKHPGHTQAEYDLAAKDHLPASYFEFVNMFMGCDKMPDKNLCFTNGTKALPEDVMAKQFSESLRLFAPGTTTPLAHMNEVIPRMQEAMGTLTPADFYDAFRDTVLLLRDRVKNV